MFGLKLNPIIIKNEVLCAKEYYAFYRQSFPFFSEPPPPPPPPPHTHFWQHFFLSISPQRNTGEVQNKLMSESYSFLKDCKTTLHATYFFLKKNFLEQHQTEIWFEITEAVVRRCSITLFEKRHWRRCFPANFAKFLTAPLFIEHFWWLLLK